MINFILPNNYFYNNLNNRLVDTQKNKSNLFQKNINFMGVNANLPFSIWNGGTLINDMFLDKIQIEDLYSTTISPLVINCSNIFISSTDIFNLKENIFLEKYQTGLNYIIVSDPNFLLLLKTKYPYYSYILSPDILQEELTKELIDNCDYIINYYNNINQNIPKNKLIIMLPMNITCYNCSNFLYCSQKEQENIYNFKTVSHFRNCQKNQIYELYLYNYNEFVKQGYTHVAFDDRAFPLKNNQLMAHFYADFFGIENQNHYLFSLLMEE